MKVFTYCHGVVFILFELLQLSVYAIDAKELREKMIHAGMKSPTPLAKESSYKIQLGKALFFDKILSGNKNISCATCHYPKLGTGDDLSVSIGEGGIGLGLKRLLAFGNFIPRNAPAVFSLGFKEAHTMFWDGRLRKDPVTGALETPEPGLNGENPVLEEMAKELTSALAAQAMFPVTSEDEMRGKAGTNEIADASSNEEVWERLMQRLSEISSYRSLFFKAYPGVRKFEDFNFAHAARAMAAFEAAAWTRVNAPIDRFLSGDLKALSISEQEGASLFVGKAKCVECHRGALLSDMEYHSVAMPQVGPGKVEPSEDRGRALVTKFSQDDYKFRTAPLRNVCRTSPWGHGGAYSKIETVIKHHLDPKNHVLNYDGSEISRQDMQMSLDKDIPRNLKRADSVDDVLLNVEMLEETEIAALKMFLCKSLSDSGEIETNALAQPPSAVPSGLSVSD